MKSESKRSVSIEELLRLKRAERPPPEFWSQFDRELREKQLAALVARRPWWHQAPRLWAGLGRYRVPFGVTAILAVTFITVRDRQPAGVARPSVLAGLPSKPAVAAVESGASVSTLAPPVIAASPSVPTAIFVSQVEAVSGQMDSDATLPGEISRMIPLMGAPIGEPVRADVATGSRLIAAAHGQSSSSEASPTRQFLGSSAGFDIRGAATRAPVEPLHQMTPPAERSRARLLTAMASMPSVEAPVRTSDRVADRLSEERLYDQIRRFGARGAGVTMKF